MLDVQSSAKGMLIPRMTSAEKTAIADPAEGLMIYQTDAVTGFWFYDGVAWNTVTLQTPGAANFRYTAAISQAINANTNTKVNFETPSFLNNATFSNSTFTVPTSGIYHLSIYLSIYGNNAGSLNVSVLSNGVIKTGVSFDIVFSVFQGVGFSDNVVLSAGDFVTVQANASADMAIVLGQSSYFTGFKIN